MPSRSFRRVPAWLAMLLLTLGLVSSVFVRRAPVAAVQVPTGLTAADWHAIQSHLPPTLASTNVSIPVQQAYLKASNPEQDDVFGYSVAIHGDTIVVGAAFEDSSTTGVNSPPNEDTPSAGAAYVFVRSGTTWSQQAYLKASNPGQYDFFGNSVAIHGDTIVVGAAWEDSSTTGVNSTPNDLADGTGAAYIFMRSGTTWSQQAYLKASNSGNGDFFGQRVGISGDTIVVGAHYEDSSTTGVNTLPNEDAPAAGAAYVFVYSGTTWMQQAYLKAANPGEQTMPYHCGRMYADDVAGTMSIARSLRHVA